MAFLLNSQAQGVSGKMNNLPKHHGAGLPDARGPMQLHQLHRLKAGPAAKIRGGRTFIITTKCSLLLGLETIHINH